MAEYIISEDFDISNLSHAIMNFVKTYGYKTELSNRKNGMVITIFERKHFFGKVTIKREFNKLYVIYSNKLIGNLVGTASIVGVSLLLFGKKLYPAAKSVNSFYSKESQKQSGFEKDLYTFVQNYIYNPQANQVSAKKGFWKTIFGK